ncbi:MAG: dipeptide/oligopeptide/nickel ABC transporter ATP-binding protein [Pseudomonadota bacterium]
MLKVQNVSVAYRGMSALEDVSFSLAAGATLAVVGESGAGKSTLIRAILGLVKCSHGNVTWSGDPVSQHRPALVMQEPRSSFNPRLALRHCVMEPLTAQRISIDHDRMASFCDSLDIAPDLLSRRPAQVSIGQAQRVGILRALIASPPLILFDEPLSALDAVTQKHTAQMICDLQSREGFAALIVTHDLGYAAAHADHIAVLRGGRIEELATARTFVEAPQSAYARKLRDAAFELGALGRMEHAV